MTIMIRKPYTARKKQSTKNKTAQKIIYGAKTLVAIETKSPNGIKSTD